MTAPTSKAQRLADEVNRHNRLYDAGTPEISDQAFDLLVEELRKEWPDAPALTVLGTTHGNEVVHRRPMLSLEKVYTDADLLRWAEKVEGDFVVMPKIDGLALSVLYKDGKFFRAATRGDGERGEDVTANAKTFVVPSLDREDMQTGIVEVRGEVFMAKKRFEEHYAQDFANPRNLAAGALKQKDPEKCKAYGLSFLAYDTDGFSVEDGKLHALEWDHDVPEHVVCKRGELVSVIKDMMGMRAQWPFEADGIVVRARSVSERERLGATGHHPRWAVAYKFQSEASRTTFEDVEWQVSRNGVLTPVAVVQPVRLAGVTVTRASLHNVGYMKKLGVRPGAIILMSRRGDVIPHVEQVVEVPDGGLELRIPERCPACDSATRLEGDFLKCTAGKECAAAVVGQVVHFARALGMDGFGTTVAEKLVSHRVVLTPPDLLEMKAAAVAALPRMGFSSAEKLVQAVRVKTQNVRLSDALRALGVDDLGQTASDLLAEGRRSLTEVMKVDPRTVGVGEAASVNIRAGLKEREDWILRMDKLLSYVQPAAVVDGPLSGQAVVFTGEMRRMGREEAQRKVQALGGKCPSSVSKKVTILVASGDDQSTKRKAAEKLREAGHPIRIIDEEEFLKLVAGAPDASQIPPAQVVEKPEGVNLEGEL